MSKNSDVINVGDVQATLVSLGHVSALKVSVACLLGTSFKKTYTMLDINCLLYILLLTTSTRRTSLEGTLDLALSCYLSRHTRYSAVRPVLLLVTNRTCRNDR